MIERQDSGLSATQALYPHSEGSDKMLFNNYHQSTDNPRLQASTFMSL